MGDDKIGELDYLKKDMNLLYIPRTEGVSSTEIRESIKANKVVMTYGTFDLFHHGHEKILKRASELGEILIVGVSSDDFNKSKGKDAYEDEQTRMQAIISLPFVNHVIFEMSLDQKRDDFKKYKVDIFTMGSD
jgi:glycerol-3-phosphate cytidylyltransferase